MDTSRFFGIGVMDVEFVGLRTRDNLVAVIQGDELIFDLLSFIGAPGGNSTSRS